jgi:signal transduction histidine kinase
MSGGRLRGWRRRTGTLRFRVSAVAVLAVVVVLGAAGVALVLAQRSTLLRDLDENLTNQAMVVHSRLTAGEPLRRVDLASDDEAVLVSGPDGDILAGSPTLIDMLFRYGPTPPRTAGSTLPLPGPDGAARMVSRTDGDRTIWVAAPLDDVRDSTAALVRSLLIAVPLSAAALAGLVWWTVGRTLRPVEGIRAEVERISDMRLEHRVPQPGTSDEIARLAHTMNDMLDRLAGTAEQQRRFVADAAHELRSPLARIRAELEVDLAHPGSADPAVTQASVAAEAARLEQLVDDLLLLARGDAGAADLRRAGPVDLDDVVERQAVARRPHGNRQIDTRGVAPVQVSGHRPQLDRAVANLLDNAVRHARSRVVVTLEETAGTVVLTVADDGPGIPADAGELVFERFARLDDARSVNDGGAGLGLAIARTIAEQHGGSLTVDGAGVPGGRFVLTLPPVSADGAPGG